MATETTTKWSIQGIYCEACNCEASCRCVFLGPPDDGECTLLVGWHIDHGSFGNVALGGLNTALAVHSPGAMTEVPWKIALYLDAKATDEQRDALTQVFAGQAGGFFAEIGGFIGEVVGVSSVAIDFQADGNRRSLTIDGVGEMHMTSVEGGGGAEIKISGNPLGLVPGEPMVLARSEKLSYHDHGMNWDISGKNGFFLPFKYEGP